MMYLTANGRVGRQVVMSVQPVRRYSLTCARQRQVDLAMVVEVDAAYAETVDVNVAVDAVGEPGVAALQSLEQPLAGAQQVGGKLKLNVAFAIRGQAEGRSSYSAGEFGALELQGVAHAANGQRYRIG